MNRQNQVLMKFCCCCCSAIQSYLTLLDSMDCSTPGFPFHHELLELALKLMSIELVMKSNHLILYCPLLLLPSIFPSKRVFSKGSTLGTRWPKDWSFSFSISPSSEYSRLISFRIDWFDLLAVQGTSQESSPTTQFNSINSWALNLLYGPTLTPTHDYWKNCSFGYMDLCWPRDVSGFNMLSRFVIAFLPKSKCLLISWLKSPSTVILESKKIVCHCFHCFPIYLQGNDRTRCHNLHFFNVEL